MFKVTIFRMRDILKYFIGSIITIILIYMTSKNFYKEAKKENKITRGINTAISSLSEKGFVETLDKVIPTISTINDEYKTIASEDDNNEENSILEAMLETQISSIKQIENMETKQTNIEAGERKISAEEQDEKIEESPTQKAQTSLKTEVITQNPIKESYNTQYGKVKIKNQTEYTLTEEIMKPDIEIENKNILLFHTHSCESYTSSEKFPYTPTGNYRSTDLNFTVTRVGTELENQLKQYNYNVIHNTDYHDHPAYNGSYTRSLATVQNILKTNQSDIIIDIHRDAIGSRSDYAPTVKIGDTDEAAQLMFVIRNKWRRFMAS